MSDNPTTMRLLLELLLLATSWINTVCSFSPPSWSLQTSKTCLTTQLAQSANDEFHSGNVSRSHGTSYISEISRRDLEERKLKGRRIPRGPVLSSSTEAEQRYHPIPLNDTNGNRSGKQHQIDSVDSMGTVYSSLESMTNLLREMRTTQTVQSADVKGLSRRMTDMTSRLDGIEGRGVGKRNVHGDINNVDATRRKREDVSVRIARLEAELDRINRLDTVIDNEADDEMLNDDIVLNASANNNDLAVTMMRVAQLEAELDRIDSTVQAMEGRLNVQGEVVERMVQESRYPDPRPPPPSSFVERRDILVSPPPERTMIDDGSVYYQERNYRRGSNSVNERSEGHYYDQPNTSFLSAFSKADNERRREFHPFANSRLRQQNTIGANANNEMPTRGIWSAPGSGGGSPRDNNQPWGRRYNWELSPQSQPPPIHRMMFPGYHDNMRYIDEDGPMRREDDYYCDNDMYEF